MILTDMSIRKAALHRYAMDILRDWSVSKMFHDALPTARWNQPKESFKTFAPRTPSIYRTKKQNADSKFLCH